jgi:hypothetical protein
VRSAGFSGRRHCVKGIAAGRGESGLNQPQIVWLKSGSFIFGKEFPRSTLCRIRGDQEEVAI